MCQQVSQPLADVCVAIVWQGSAALLSTSTAPLPPNVRVTRQAAARARQAAVQQQLEQQLQAPGTDSMEVDTTEPMETSTLDPTHRSDPQDCNHYVNEIYAYLQELEVGKQQVSPHFMQVRPHAPEPHPVRVPASDVACPALASSRLTILCVPLLGRTSATSTPRCELF